MNLSPQALDKLAAEYALGTLKGAARRRFESLMQADASVRQVAAAWQERLHPIGLMGQPVQPSPRVWDAVERATRPTDLPATSPGKRAPDTLRSLPFWRWFALSSTALAGLLLALLLMGRPEPAPQTLPGLQVAVLVNQQSEAAFLASVDANGQLRLQVLKAPVVPPDRVLELWALPAQGKPLSLGVMDKGQTALRLAPGAMPGASTGLAISLEPQGGSNNPDGPSGPVLFTGRWMPA